jgi:hypothetical protein
MKKSLVIVECMSWEQFVEVYEFHNPNCVPLSRPKWLVSDSVAYVLTCENTGEMVWTSFNYSSDMSFDLEQAAGNFRDTCDEHEIMQ